MDLQNAKGTFTSNKITGQTAEEAYQEWLDNQNKKTEPTQDEILSKEVASIKIDSMKKDLVITNALQTIASLKVEVMGLKGGNA